MFDYENKGKDKEKESIPLLALASLAFGLMSLYAKQAIYPGMIAVLAGMAALGNIRKGEGKGRIIAFAGILLGFFACSMFVSQQIKMKKSMAPAQVKVLGQKTIMTLFEIYDGAVQYHKDYGKFPGDMNDLVYSPNAYLKEEAVRRKNTGYAFDIKPNVNEDKLTVVAVPNKWTVFGRPIFCITEDGKVHYTFKKEGVPTSSFCQTLPQLL